MTSDAVDVGDKGSYGRRIGWSTTVEHDHGARRGTEALEGDIVCKSALEYREGHGWEGEGKLSRESGANMLQEGDGHGPIQVP